MLTCAQVRAFRKCRELGSQLVRQTVYQDWGNRTFV